jgi:hypothetical protein
LGYSSSRPQAGGEILGQAIKLNQYPTESGACQTKTDENQPLEYAQPSKLNTDRGFNGMVIGVIVGWFSGIAFAIVACSTLSRVFGREDAAGWFIFSLLFAILSAAGGGWIGRRIGISRSN